MTEQRVIEDRPFGALMEIEGREVYVPRLLDVRGGRVVRYANGPERYRAMKYQPPVGAMGAGLGHWECVQLDGEGRPMWDFQRSFEPQDLFCYAEDNQGSQGS